MNDNLKDQLCEFLGELLYERENQFDWFEKDKITKKINAVNELLGIEKREEPYAEKIIRLLNTFKSSQ